MTVRTRFAPSPTGFLHLGNIRTAVFAWAFARRHSGQFVLRIEDTDLERSTDEFKEGILRDLKWLGLDWDEGPVYQMQRMDRYRAVLADWLKDGRAYYCYASPEELEQMREAQMTRGEKPRYDGRWRPENAAGKAPPPGVKPVIRFRNPDDGVVSWDDAVKGRIEIANRELDDLILARPDGTPTYNFCVVIDDVDMNITHVIRGDDHVNNTPRQINMFNALGAKLPVFAHTPTVLGQDGEKLSKRHGATSLVQYAEEGYLPETMVNFLARLGWSHGNEEVFSPQQLAEWFDLEHINPAPGKFDPEKLAWLNQEHMKRTSLDALAARAEPFFRGEGFDLAKGPPVSTVVELYRERVSTLKEMAQQAGYFYHRPHVDGNLIAKHVNDANRAALTELAAQLQSIVWNKESIAAAAKAIVAQHKLKMPQIMMPLRVMLTGLEQTPAVDAVMAALGRDECLARIAAAPQA